MLSGCSVLCLYIYSFCCLNLGAIYLFYYYYSFNLKGALFYLIFWYQSERLLCGVVKAGTMNLKKRHKPESLKVLAHNYHIMSRLCRVYQVFLFSFFNHFNFSAI